MAHQCRTLYDDFRMRRVFNAGEVSGTSHRAHVDGEGKERGQCKTRTRSSGHRRNR